MTIKAKTGQKSAYALQQKRHFCPEHDVVCTAAMRMPRRRMIWTCPKGCSLPKNGTILK